MQRKGWQYGYHCVKCDVLELLPQTGGIQTGTAECREQATERFLDSTIVGAVVSFVGADSAAVGAVGGDSTAVGADGAADSRISQVERQLCLGTVR